MVDEKRYTLGETAIKQLRDTVKRDQQRIDRLSAEPRRNGRGVQTGPRMVYVAQDVAPGDELNCKFVIGPDGETDTKKVTVKNWFKNHTVRGLTIWWVTWYRGGWKFMTGECPADA